MKFRHRRAPKALAPAVLILIVLSPAAMADVVVDKVYPPYVLQLEREIELRSLVHNDENKNLDGLQIHRLGFGWSWSDRLFSELYLIGTNTNDESLHVDAYEIETKWQLTEQGEYWADWGLLFELEKVHDLNVWEYATRMIVLKEWDRWVTTANLSLIYEWGNDIANEWETALALQGRYRLMRSFEPALEFYGGEHSKGLGPVFLGDVRTGQKSKLHWEVGVIFGLDRESAAQTFRGLLEFEF
jgi:hypothetical protein